MARSAGRRRWRHVRSRQGKPGRTVIECCGRPTHRRMAGGTIRHSECRAGCGVRRIIRLLPGRQMASRVATIVLRGRQGVIIIDVAGSAGRCSVRTGQQKTGRAMVESRRRRRRPTYCVMARAAIRQAKLHPGRWVRRIIGLLPSRQMAARIPAIGRRNHQVIVVINMAGSARHVGMPIRQQKTRLCVVKGGIQPRVHPVTRLAGRREPCVNMVWIGSLLKFSRMA